MIIWCACHNHLLSVLPDIVVERPYIISTMISNSIAPALLTSVIPNPQKHSRSSRHVSTMPPLSITPFADPVLGADILQFLELSIALCKSNNMYYYSSPSHVSYAHFVHISLVDISIRKTV